MRQQAANSFLVSAILTSLFIAFNLTGITHFHWALILLPVWLPILVMIAAFEYSKRNRPKRKDWDDEEDIEYSFIHSINVIKTNSPADFEKQVADYKTGADHTLATSQYFYDNGIYTAIFELEKRVKK